MDETVDLRPYVDALLKYWWVIAGGVILVVALALIQSFLATPQYQATALIAITDPQQRVQFDPRFVDTTGQNPLLKAYPELALSDELLSNVLEQATAASQGEITTLSQLKGMLEAEAGSDPRLLHLRVYSDDPQLSATIANEWAQQFVPWANAIYGNQAGPAAFYETQLTDANTNLESAEAALVQFQAENRSVIVENLLLAQTQLQSAYLEDQRKLMLLGDDIESLIAQLSALSSPSITLADQLTALVLQVKVYDAGVSVPALFQLTPQDAVTVEDRQEQIRLLEELAVTVENNLAAIDQKLADLEPQILALQEEKQRLLAESNRLQRRRDVSQETYLALARKVDEERITSQDTSSGVRLASQAAVPLEPARSGLLLTVLVAGFVGLAVGAAIVLLLTWWRQYKQVPE